MIWERHGSTDDLRPQIALVFWGTFALGFGSALLLPGAPRLAPRRRDQLLRPSDPGGCDSLRRMDVLTGRSQSLPVGLRTFPSAAAGWAIRHLDVLVRCGDHRNRDPAVGVSGAVLHDHLSSEGLAAATILPVRAVRLRARGPRPRLLFPAGIAVARAPSRPDGDKGGPNPQRPRGHSNRDSGGRPVLRMGVSPGGFHGARRSEERRVGKEGRAG